jgi:hypothetical protein
MKITATILFIALSAFMAQAQTVTEHIVEPKGVYREIDTKNDVRVMASLLDPGNSTKSKLIDSIIQLPNNYDPPVLYVLSNVFFTSGKYNDAIFWFYLAQLRARYDVNRCTDKTASAAQYNQTFGPDINQYAFAHLDDLEKIIPKVIEFERSNEEKYDHRWINLTGMGAMNSALANKVDEKPLSKAQSEWPAIKKATIDDYEEGFKQALISLKKKQ